MNFEIECNNYVNNSMIFRSVITIITFILLYKSCNNNKFINKNIYIILPILLYLLDILDGEYLRLFNKKNCCKYFQYQLMDKIIDIISYCLLFFIIKKDIILYICIIYRLIGVILFIITKNSYFLVIFFDFVKEYLLYRYIFDNNYKYIYVFIMLKIMFEYLLHIIYENSNYNFTKKNNNRINHFLQKYIFL